MTALPLPTTRPGPVLTLPRVVLEHPDFYLVDKPPLWLTHRARGRLDLPNLLDALQLELGEPELAPPHRLDRETSGAQLLSRDPDAARAFFTLFKEHLIGKTYLGLVHGHPGWDECEVDAPLGSLGLSASNAVLIRQGVVVGGRPARTDFRVLGRRSHPLHGPLALLAARPRSGRLHQIRAHLRELGLPLVGDKIYGLVPDAFLSQLEDRLTPAQRDRLILPRQALHAWKVKFPWANAVVDAEVPLAPDIAGLWAQAAGQDGDATDPEVNDGEAV